jgi:hypothetical protein
MKAGLSLVNTTAALTRGGRVYVAEFDQRFTLPDAPSAMTDAEFHTFVNVVVAHPNTRPFSGSDFVKARLFSCKVNNAAEYETFGPWAGPDNLNTFMSHVAVWPGAVELERPMSTLVLVIETPASPQDYTISMRSNFYTKWPLSTFLGSLMVKVPTGAVASVDKTYEGEQGGEM